MKNLSVEWFLGVAPERKEGVEQAIRNSSTLCIQVLHILDKWEEELNAAESKISDYDTPSWECKQAHRNGDRSRIRKLRELFGFIKEK